MLEIVFLAQNKNSNTNVYRYITRMIIGLIVGINIGIWIDTKLNTIPLFTISIVLYVVFGTLFLLIKEAS